MGLLRLFAYFFSSKILLVSGTTFSNLSCPSLLASGRLALVDLTIAQFNMAETRKYEVSVPSTAIEDLRQRLALAKFPDVVDGDDEGLGSSIQRVRRVVKYWREEFEWGSFEERLNKLPHFEMTISLEGFDPFDVHFMHQRSPNPDAIPLLFVHGCVYSLSQIYITESHD